MADRIENTRKEVVWEDGRGESLGSIERYRTLGNVSFLGAWHLGDIDIGARSITEHPSLIIELWSATWGPFKFTEFIALDGLLKV